MGTTELMAQFITDTPRECIPEAILHEGKRCFINYLAVALYASRDASFDILLGVFGDEGGRELASVVGTNLYTSLQNAALANGYLGHLEDYDDTHFPTVIHPSSPTLPAVLAVGEQLRVSGDEALVAAILGMEVCCRIGMAIHPYHYNEGWHITGTCGVFGSVASAGKLMGFEVDRMVQAMGIAGTQASGVREVFGSMTKPFHAGRAAQSGVLAALLAQRGFTSTKTIIEGRRGFATVLSSEYDLEKATAGFCKEWELYMNGLKPYACGVVSHPLIDAMIAMRSKDGVEVASVESISAIVHPLVLELVNRQHPKIGLEGKFSYHHSMAVGLVDGGAFPLQYTDNRVNDPVITNLRDRITAIADESLGEDQAIVTVNLRDGRSYTERIDHATGAPENPMSDSYLEDKFRNLTEDVLPKNQRETLLDKLWNLETVTDLGEILSLTRVAHRSSRG
jgi:2-methylcitrate dehydratase PrpD